MGTESAVAEFLLSLGPGDLALAIPAAPVSGGTRLGNGLEVCLTDLLCK